jgi:hypothetical protein
MSIDLSCSTIALLTATLCMATANAEAPNEEVKLSVKPRLCVTGKREQACETSFQVQWISTRIDRYCLQDDISSAPLRCWQRDADGRFEEDRVVERSFSYQLTKPGQDPPLAETRIELLSLESSDRRRNRRNRHAWSIR